jgi:hypothetical protein
MYRNGFVFRLIGVLLLIGIMVAGGFMAYKAGVAQGVIQAPAVATAISQAAENGQAAPVPPMYGYGHPYRGYGYPHHFGFFPLGAICFSIFFVFLFFGLLKMIFFRRMRHGWGHHGHWKKDWESGVPPMFDEWHKRAHEGGEKSTDGEEK